MNSEELKILTNIIGAVESGGQVYGKRDYSAYAGAYTNSDKEHTCTLGWAQNYGYEAMKLCQDIYIKSPLEFNSADTANIASMLKEDWVAKRWNPNEAQKKALIAIITTNAGKKCQDELFEELMTKYIKMALEYDQTMSVPAQMMWCEICHLGGYKSVKRIFDRAERPFTEDTIFASLILDQRDNSSNNQVGDKKFQSRHECCVKWIKQYVSDKEHNMTEAQLRKRVADFLIKYIGISEGSEAHKEILKIFNNSGLCPRYTMTTKDAWCATAVSAAFIANKLAGKLGSGALFECVECSCNYMIELAKKQGIWQERDDYVPKTGDVIFYDWQDTTDSTSDNKGSSEHTGVVDSCDGRIIKVIEGNKNDTVEFRTLYVNSRYIRGFITPRYYDYSSVPSHDSIYDDTLQEVQGIPDKIIASSRNIFEVSKNTAPSYVPLFAGKVTASALNVRKWAGTENARCSFSPLKQGDIVIISDAILDSKYKTWYFIKYNSKHGFVSSSYIKKV